MRAKSRQEAIAEGGGGEPGAPPLAAQLASERERADALASELAALKTRLQARPSRSAAAAGRARAGGAVCGCKRALLW